MLDYTKNISMIEGFVDNEELNSVMIKLENEDMNPCVANIYNVMDPDPLRPGRDYLC